MKLTYAIFSLSTHVARLVYRSHISLNCICIILFRDIARRIVFTLFVQLDRADYFLSVFVLVVRFAGSRNVDSRTANGRANDILRTYFCHIKAVVIFYSNVYIVTRNYHCNGTSVSFVEKNDSFSPIWRLSTGNDIFQETNNYSFIMYVMFYVYFIKRRTNILYK